MLLVDSMKREEDHFLLGAASAVIAGTLVTYIHGFSGLAGELLSEPALVSFGMLFAALGGGILARRAIVGALVDAIGIGLLLGLIVPVGAGGIAFPLLGVIGAPVMWPATVPAGVAWVFIVRALADRPARDQVVRIVAALILVIGALGIRYTEPAWISIPDGAGCLSFPREYVGSLAWSPDGAWLAIGSSHREAGGIVRLIDPKTERILELVRAPGIDIESGLAVGPTGDTAYLQRALDSWGAGPGANDPPWSVMIASPTGAPRQHADLPTAAVQDLTYTRDGIAGVLTWDPETEAGGVDRLVWIDAGTSVTDRLREVTAAEAARHPVLAPMLGPENETLRIATPIGTRLVQRPNASGDVSVTRDGREVVYVLWVPIGETTQDEVHGVSTETGHHRILAVDHELDDARLAGGWLAYRTTAYPTNSVCLKAVEPLG
jgi:hypothetical protein